MRSLFFAIALAAATAASAQINDSEVWVGTLDMSDGALRVSNLKNVSNHPGYDNQPAFFPDGRLVYTSQIADLDDTGRAVQATIVDPRTGSALPLAGAFGFSPTPAADGRSLMLLREGRVWLHQEGKEPVALTETKDAGYYARFDDRTWVLFMNDSDRRIVIYDAATKALETMARGAMTAPYRIPGRRAVTFVAEEPFPKPDGDAAKAAPPRTVHLRELDLDKRQVKTLAAIPFPTAGSHLWTSRGTILIASANTIYEWNPARPDEWPTAARFEQADLQGITRIAINPAGDRIALVSTPRDETMIRNSRAASNAALAARKPAAFVQTLHTDSIVLAANGQAYRGREAVRQEMESRWQATPDLVYARTPARVEVGPLGASERGTWTGRGTTPAGPAEWHGEYLAGWRRTMTPAGLPSWTIGTEMFVVLHCNGAGCSR